MTDVTTPVRRSVTVAADLDRAFRLFTTHFDAWWPRGHHIGTADLSHAVLEPRDGGRWYEVGVDGTECEWGRVLTWDPPSRLVLAWHLNGRWEYDPDPSRASEVEVTFTATDDGTTVALEHRFIERMLGGDDAHAAVGGDGGWAGILASFAAVVAASSR